MTTYAVIGAGGVGGYYGVHLARTGAHVHFLIRAGADTNDPLTLVSGEQTFEVQPGYGCTVHRDWAEMPQVDTVIVAVKATANADVSSRVGAIVRPGGAVVLAQNGIDAEPQYAAALGPDVELIGGLAFLASYRAAPTRFVHIDYGALTLARYVEGYAPGGASPAMAALQHDLAKADVPVVLAADLLAARWQKLVWNIPFNGLSVLLDAHTDELMADEAATRLATDLMAEVVAAARADGRPLTEGIIDAMIAMTRVMKRYAPSMKLDYDAGRPLEVQAMYRAAISRAERAGAQLPKAAMLADALEFLDARNSSA